MDRANQRSSCFCNVSLPNKWSVKKKTAAMFYLSMGTTVVSFCLKLHEVILYCKLYIYLLGTYRMTWLLSMTLSTLKNPPFPAVGSKVNTVTLAVNQQFSPSLLCHQTLSGAKWWGNKVTCVTASEAVKDSAHIPWCHLATLMRDRSCL